MLDKHLQEELLMPVEIKSLRLSCLRCKATGLERIGGSQKALECESCAGSGALAFAYTPFTGRVAIEDVLCVFPHTGHTVTPNMRRAPDTGEDLGAMPYEVWQALPLGKASLLKESDAATKAVLLKLKGLVPFGISLHNGSIPMQIVCQSCSGTGLFIGNMECAGAAVPCVMCLGTGSVTVRYNAFEKRQQLGNITHVFPYTVGSAVRRLQGTPEFGTPYAIWQARGCRQGDEPRALACPVEIYDRDVLLFGETAMKADTDWCLEVLPAKHRWGRGITQCPAYPFKAACWRACDASDSTDRDSAMASLQVELKTARRYQGKEVVNG